MITMIFIQDVNLNMNIFGIRNSIYCVQITSSIWLGQVLRWLHVVIVENRNQIVGDHNVLSCVRHCINQISAKLRCLWNVPISLCYQLAQIHVRFSCRKHD